MNDFTQKAERDAMRQPHDETFHSSEDGGPILAKSECWFCGLLDACDTLERERDEARMRSADLFYEREKAIGDLAIFNLTVAGQLERIAKLEAALRGLVRVWDRYGLRYDGALEDARAALEGES